jgi:Chalcone isomerase-like
VLHWFHFTTLPLKEVYCIVSGIPTEQTKKQSFIETRIKMSPLSSSTSSLLGRAVQCLLVAYSLLSTTCRPCAATAAAGVNFASKWRDQLDLFGVGVRKKAVINVYAVAMYAQSELKEKLGEFSLSKQKKEALECLRQGAVGATTSDAATSSSSSCAFLLEMTFKAGAEKIASALADSVATRYKGSSSDVDSFKALVLNGLSASGKTAATKGTRFEFHCQGSGLHVSVDGKDQGQVESPGLAKAFCNVYLDDNCVSPAFRDNILECCCAP